MANDLPIDPASLLEAAAARLAGGRRRPVATYRLQLHAGFGFGAATEIVPYLAALGISDVYLSPYLRAVKGSLHGYDIVDHQSLNPEIGGEAELAALEAALGRRGLGQILDVVPNHMGIGSENRLWLDVLENGPSSSCARFFDIDWKPVKEELRNKVLLPILGDQYGLVLERGELRLRFEDGAFEIRYFEQRLPIDPRRYPLILGERIGELGRRLGGNREALEDCESLLLAFGKLPDVREQDAEQVATREREKEVQKRRLARLCERCPEVEAFVQENVALFNGRRGDRRSFDLLDRLLDGQVYRLAHWRVAGEEINYRRFFDINDLAAIRMEDPVVFEEAHRRIFEAISRGHVTGLRVDHPDGLYDPAEYFERIQRGFVLLVAREIARERGVASAEAWAPIEVALRDRLSREAPLPPSPLFRPLYVVAEKILTGRERMPSSWAVHGTTGYDFLNSLGALFVDSENAAAFDRLYARAVGEVPEFGELVYQKKKVILGSTMASEINVLARRLNRLSELNRRTRDFTLNSLTRSLVEFIACFPVYRTYLRETEGVEEIDERDRRYVGWAIERAKRRNPTMSASIFDFLAGVLLRDSVKVGPEELSEKERIEALAFVLRLQQLTGPVMAKSVEDTSFYLYNRLVALNEVGGEPERFGITPSAFHAQSLERARSYPFALLATSTHDTKRSEDVRARLVALSELPVEWETRLQRWMALNRAQRISLPDDRLVPDPNEELLLYQTLLGVWPLEGGASERKGFAGDAWRDFLARLEAYAVKAAREAKLHTSWVNPDPAYEAALGAFLRRILPERAPPDQATPFLDDFLPFERRLARCGLWTSLSQLLIKVAAPGVPDFYQGNELWEFSLVDPDNRRPVDFRRRARLLEELKSRGVDRPERRAALASELLQRPEDDRLKLFVTYLALRARRGEDSPMQRGDYQPLTATGVRADRIVTFARSRGDRLVVAVAPRLWAGLLDEAGGRRAARENFRDGWIELPVEPRVALRNAFTGLPAPLLRREGKAGLALAELLDDFPVALLEGAS